jgi:hypothetical protein
MPAAQQPGQILRLRKMTKKKAPLDRPRRKFLLSSAAFLTAAASPALRAQTSETLLTLADFGGYPGLSGKTIVNAFIEALNYLKNIGGGTLIVAPGRYYLGSYSKGIYLIGIRDLENVEILGHGAVLELTTTGDTLPTVPVFFRLENPNNVTLRGLAFEDHGTDLTVHYKGASCLDIVITRPCRAIRTIDCVADHVVTFVRSFGDGPYAYMLTDCEFNGTVRNAYYGVSVRSTGSFSSCNLRCDAVRRGFIGYNVKNWNITLHFHSIENARGSNGFICLIPFTNGSVEDCAVHVTVTGSTRPYSALVHFYHQAQGNTEYIRNVTADVTLDNAVGDATVFLFDHALETGIAPMTLRTFENITLTGLIKGKYAGKIIDNPSVSLRPGNDIKVSSHLIGPTEIPVLPRYIRSFMPD